MEAIVILLALVWGVLNLILFFKIWNMCNDVADIKDSMQTDSPDARHNLLLGDKATAARQIIAKNTGKLTTLYEMLQNADCTEENREKILAKMDTVIANLNKAFDKFELAGLPSHLKSREAFVLFYETLKKY